MLLQYLNILQKYMLLFIEWFLLCFWFRTWLSEIYPEYYNPKYLQKSKFLILFSISSDICFDYAFVTFIFIHVFSYMPKMLSYNHSLQKATYIFLDIHKYHWMDTLFFHVVEKRGNGKCNHITCYQNKYVQNKSVNTLYRDQVILQLVNLSAYLRS